MENKYEEHFILMPKQIENNKKEMKAEMKDIKQEMKAKMKYIKETLKVFTTFMMNHINIPKYSPIQKDAFTPPEPTTVVLTNRRVTPLEWGHSTKIGGMWTLKH